MVFCPLFLAVEAHVNFSGSPAVHINPWPLCLSVCMSPCLLLRLQVSYSVIDRRPELFLSRFCEARGISLLAYGTLAGGFLSERFKDLPADM